MTVIAGLPAHVLFVHFMVVLAPLTAVLEILCAVWPAARRRLVWLVLALATVTLVLTPLTIEAGEWLFDREQNPGDALQVHAERGEWMIYFSVAMALVAVALTVLHWLDGRSDRRRTLAIVGVALTASIVGISSIVAVVRIGDSGARAVWGGELTEAD
ncbi:DUF2231 domain-containing protein [Mycobacterium sp. 852002-51961_SCH5331710]|uniref:DUF2231 domain-containing protein n=1 Tax=Mycobacterium sp. 852002-51961_SCH5331710 TaxID=1834105 RepID=UPI0008025464|nr:DUF2231 domain-containing protein [Mycobacterium sp. 852002-51961_SCH5331710]OBB37318.1 hypothetical protein A5752_14900 [Mycobacterium sp. 852002-51961_SCH5331710]